MTQVSAPSDTANIDRDRPALQHRNPRYQVMRDDVIALSFPLSPELNQTVTIQPDGYITLQNAGSIFIQGMTVPEVAEAVKKAYLNILHDPIVGVDLKDFQRPFFLVSGQVGKPGRYDLREDTTVSEAIAVAGGFLPTAKTQVFLYHRISPGWVQVKKLSLKDLLNGKNVNEDVQMQPGDMIFVPEKFITNFRKYVPYTVGLYLNPAVPAL
jgi:polysaccharide export outer membrane protein